jgi:DNA-binding protein HU-beta
MNKSEFVNYIAAKNNCTKVEAEKVIDIFTTSIIDALGEGEEVALIGFGNFSVSKRLARTGRNPATGKEMEIAASNQARFKVGSKLKAACNK